MNKEILNLILAILFVFLLMTSFLIIPIALAWFTGTDALGTVFFFIFMILLLIVYSLYIGRKSIDWPTVEGVVVGNEYSLNYNRTKASLNLEYKYEVFGKVYTNRIISPTVKEESPSIVLEKSEKYAKDSKVMVHYDPFAPKKSVLEPGVAKSSYLVAIVFAIGSAVSFYFAFKNWEGLPQDRLAIVLSFLKSKI